MLTAEVWPPVIEVNCSVAVAALTFASVIGMMFVATTTVAPFVRRVLMQYAAFGNRGAPAAVSWAVLKLSVTVPGWADVACCDATGVSVAPIVLVVQFVDRNASIRPPPEVLTVTSSWPAAIRRCCQVRSWSV